ncbi:hypothetical protein N7504_000005 [Penicillium tannophilum]|nr:hypothetical protein N7504_000005 [Penicillium tannophilum]
MVGDSQQGLAKLNSSTTEPLDSLHPRDYEIDTEPSQISKLSENPCSMANDALNKSLERAKDSGIANPVLSADGALYIKTFSCSNGTSPVLSRPHTAVILGKHSTNTSDENALLMRLKEKEVVLWSEITTHFLGRNMLSLQAYHSTKLRHKASSRSRKPRGRE